jgi:NADH-quinone oxidoreductase subunit L
MPITWITSLLGSLALIGTPLFAGFYSKDSIIEAVHASHTPGAGIAYIAVLLGVFVGAVYSFRLVFFAFHGKERFDTHGHDHGGDHAAHGHDDHGHGGVPHESPWVVWLPLVLLAIPSVGAGWLIGTVLYGGYFDGAIHFSAAHPVMKELTEEFHGVWPMMMHGLTGLPFWFAVAGLVLSWYLYILRPDLPAVLRKKAGVLVFVLEQKYGFDRFNDWFFAGGARVVGSGLWKFGDLTVIDGIMVNGTARLVGWIAGVVRLFQSGYIYHYAFAMIIGVFVLLTLWFARG